MPLKSLGQGEKSSDVDAFYRKKMWKRNIVVVMSYRTLTRMVSLETRLQLLWELAGVVVYNDQTHIRNHRLMRLMCLVRMVGRQTWSNLSAESGLNVEIDGDEQNLSLERTSTGCESQQRSVGTHSWLFRGRRSAPAWPHPRAFF